jgi:predicted nucleotidyltransferase
MIRNSLGEGLDKIKNCLPEKSFEILCECASRGKAPSDIKNVERAVLAFFRLADPAALAKENIAEAGGGLAERVCKFSRIAKSYDELVGMTSGKNYTNSRVRRVILACMTGATEDDVRRTPAYSTVLGFNSAGRELLAAQRKREDGEIVFITKPADAPALSESAARQFYLSERADALFTLASPEPDEKGEYISRSPVYFE